MTMVAAARFGLALVVVAGARGVETMITSETLAGSGKAAGPTLEAPFFGRLAAHKGCAAYCAAASGRGAAVETAVFLQHLRKAGGTLLRSYLVNYRCDVGASRRRESRARAGTARVVVQEQLAFNTYALAQEPHALFVTCLRDPVDRVVSLYFFEGKWKQKDFRRLNSTAEPLARWIARTAQQSARRGAQAAHAMASQGAWPPRTRIWEEVAEYYTQIFSGVAAHPATDAHYEAARAALASFDVILILERLATPEGRNDAETLLRAVLPPSTAGCAPAILATPVNKGRTRDREAPLSEADRESIRRLNPFDLKLYADAVAMSDAQVAARGPPPCPAKATANCSVAQHDDHPNMLSGENIMRGCHRFHRPCDRKQPKPPAEAPPRPTAIPLSSVPLSNRHRPPGAHHAQQQQPEEEPPPAQIP